MRKEKESKLKQSAEKKMLVAYYCTTTEEPAVARKFIFK